MQKIEQKSKTTLKSSYYCHVSRDTLNVVRVKGTVNVISSVLVAKMPD